MSPSRRLLLLAGAVALGLRLPAARVWASPPPGAASRLRALAQPAQSARALGRAYLAGCPAEASTRVLVDLVLSSLGLTERALAELDEQRLHARLRLRIRDDFAAGRTASVDGWILSRIEARLMALQA